MYTSIVLAGLDAAHPVASASALRGLLVSCRVSYALQALCMSVRTLGPPWGNNRMILFRHMLEVAARFNFCCQCTGRLGRLALCHVICTFYKHGLEAGGRVPVGSARTLAALLHLTW